ncbi:glucan endo-1,3-beta-glucosidase 8-like [Rhododendron vialii]|uniref:glucan endo-1,3-beta-glucosidase 8-like n=1 Tax=Rhododendron vialii TaxID=182163 RepID=UPI00265E8079|nr:glucan endo-1,3-beta-glucosidase 8-like [Rhododendron vialii]XP_058186037.1 glucan endo-1,3-beta-glucosidase 8-like [Rhododendron vialii]
MARAMVLLWACSLLLVSANVAEAIGVNWGNTLSSHNLLPSVVVRLLKDNGIDKVKLFDSDPWIVKAFAGASIEVMLGVPNSDLKRLSDDYGQAQDWVKHNLTKHLYQGGVDIKFVAVGNEPFLKSYNGSYLHITLPAMKNVQKAINEAGHGDTVKVTTPLNADVYESAGSTVPSAGDFRSDIRSLMVEMVRWLDSNNAPFLVNIYPYLSLYQNPDFPVDFAFFDGNAKPLQDKGITYTNMFDANLDTLVWSLRKAGVPKLDIIVGEAGWPTDGDKDANVKYAKRFYDGFLKKIASNEGTPLRPGHMEAYLFGLLDEDMKSVAPGNFERHWGIFRFDGQPKFEMDFTGKGNDKMPVAAKDVQYLAKRWCVFNKDVKNMSLVAPNMNYACSAADCTPLGYGSSCNNLDMYGNISYAFNMYYQMNDQSAEACVFQGLATLDINNPSNGTCVFPIQIQSAGTRLGTVSRVSVVVSLLVFLALF